MQREAQDTEQSVFKKLHLEVGGGFAWGKINSGQVLWSADNACKSWPFACAQGGTVGAGGVAVFCW